MGYFLKSLLSITETGSRLFVIKLQLFSSTVFLHNLQVFIVFIIFSTFFRKIKYCQIHDLNAGGTFSSCILLVWQVHLHVFSNTWQRDRRPKCRTYIGRWMGAPSSPDQNHCPKGNRWRQISNTCRIQCRIRTDMKRTGQATGRKQKNTYQTGKRVTDKKRDHQVLHTTFWQMGIRELHWIICYGGDEWSGIRCSGKESQVTKLGGKLRRC